MVDQRLTAKPELTTPHADDVVHIVDVSDTTDSPEGSSKKIKYSNLAGSGGGESTSDDSNTVTFENVHGKFYNLDIPNGLDITIDDTGAVFGGVAIVYSIGTVEPTITGGTVVSKVGAYNTDGSTLNVIFITRDTRGNFIVNTIPNSFAGYVYNVEAEVQALLDQAAIDGYTPVNGTKLIKLNTFIKGLKDNGIYSLLDRLWITDTNGDSDFSRYDIINPTDSGRTLLTVGTPTFAINDGWTGAAASALDTQYVASTDASNWLLDSCGLFLDQQAQTNSGHMYGALSGGGLANRIDMQYSGGYAFTTNASALKLLAGARTSGSMMITRTGSTTSKRYLNGVEVDTSTSVSTGLPSVSLYLLDRNGAGSNFNNGTMAMFGIGGDLTGKEAILDSLITAYRG